MFDIKNEQFYVNKDMIQLKEKVKTNHDIQIATDGDKFYGVFTIFEWDRDADVSSDSDNESLNSYNESSYSYKYSVDSDPTNYKALNEIRTFQFENETLVETGLKWKSSDLKIRRGEINNWNCPISSHFVKMVKLN